MYEWYGDLKPLKPFKSFAFVSTRKGVDQSPKEP